MHMIKNIEMQTLSLYSIKLCKTQVLIKKFVHKVNCITNIPKTYKSEDDKHHKLSVPFVK